MKGRVVAVVLGVAALFVGCGEEESPEESRSSSREESDPGAFELSEEPPPSPGGEEQDPVNDGRLVMHREGLSDNTLRRILETPRAERITDIAVHGNYLTPEGVRLIVESPVTEGLTWLNLDANPIGDDGLIILARSERLRSVQRLFLADVNATARGIGALAGSTHLGPLQTLSLGFQEVGDAGARALASVEGVERLALQQAGIGGLGARSLLEDGGAESIDLSGNSIGPGGLVGLQRVSPAIVSLDLSETSLSSADLTALSAVEATGLRELSIDGNRNDDTGLRAVAAASWLAQLEILEIGGYFASPQSRRELIAAWGERRGLMMDMHGLK